MLMLGGARRGGGGVGGVQVSFAIGEIAKKEGIKVDVQEVEGQMALLRQQFQVLPPHRRAPPGAGWRMWRARRVPVCVRGAGRARGDG